MLPSLKNLTENTLENEAERPCLTTIFFGRIRKNGDSQDGDFGIRIESDILATVAETPYKMLSFGKRAWEMIFACCEMLHVLDVSVIVHIHD